ncbi:CRISPR-associated helicase Cas3' [Rhodothalassium salexigens]|uniref:CRISPR-associated helicase Cas3' n=1 Tax=Rhodothalassium salexigens TaxID=1086 RepID=UPI001913E287|nr:CRISPR-associated helicase Cas3' [Rhodothalassium salexigens]
MPRENLSSLLAFWGKAQPFNADTTYPLAHPLAYHCLDVAAVTERLLSADAVRRAALAHALGVAEGECVCLLVTLAALHDIGKASLPFQAKAPEHRPAVLSDYPVLADPGHDTTAWLWFVHFAPRALKERLAPIGALNRLLPAAFGHHGRPPSQDRPPNRARAYFPPESVEAANALADWILARLGPAEPLRISTDLAKRAALAVAGLIAASDWIGSAQRWFAYTPPDHDLDSYWHDIARPRAEKAVQGSGVVPAPPAPLRPFHVLTNLPEGSATPLQRWADTVALPAGGPLLCLLEDLTGSGKTEAALMLAHRLMASGRAGGLYLALPTQATANAMFDRLGGLYRRLFEPEATPSLALAHGDRGLHPGFRAATLPATQDDQAYGDGAAETVADVPAGAQCAAWVADDRRLAFLADVGAGTVDQALLSVLPARHAGLRRWGLLGKVLILDEIHAYDAYVGEEIAALVEAHAALGGHTILLSATLPASLRDKLTSAFRRGIGLAPPPPPDARAAEAMPYPAGTVLCRTGEDTRPIAAWSHQARRLPVRTLATPEQALDEAEAAARDGQAVLVLRNTVDEATSAYDVLRDRGLSPLLFHARFALGDRLAIEAEVMRRFGRHSKSEARAGTILVATQVVEQSLDVDFDALFTDLAPIDLLIQRAGRLWRHARKGRPGREELVVVTPPALPDPGEVWVRAALPGTAAVYRHHGVLWRTAGLLETDRAFDLPDRARALIERVYGPTAPTPEALVRSSTEAEGQAMAGRAKARAEILPLSAGYTDSHHWEPDHRIRTRDADDPAPLRLGRWQDGVIQPWVDPDPMADRPAAIAWRLSQVSWRLKRLARAAWEEPDPALARAAAEARKTWGRWERDLPLVVLQPAGEGSWTGEARDDEGQTLPIRYCPRRGLSLA